MKNNDLVNFFFINNYSKHSIFDEINRFFIVLVKKCGVSDSGTGGMKTILLA